jgi:acyl dehydratase
MPATVFENLDSLLSAGRRDLGSTEWVELTKSVIADFAAATWSPGGPEGEDSVAPPMLLLSLTNRLLPDLLEVRGASSGVNYGTGPVRFGALPQAGDRIRASALLVESAEAPAGVQTTVQIRIEVEGADSPACTVDSLSRWLR